MKYKVIIFLLFVIFLSGCETQIEDFKQPESAYNPVPQNVRIVSRTPYNINIGWDNVVNAAGYKVYTSPDNITYTPESSKSNTYNMTLDTGEFVYCKITAIIDGNESETSYPVLKAYTALETPDFNVTGDTDDFTTCHVTWSSVDKATKR